MSIVYDLVKPSELEAAIELEKEGYPEDEAASLKSFRYRQANAPELFLGAYLQGSDGQQQLIGYVCSTLSASTVLTHDSMATHDPAGRTVCVHSVCVARAHRRRGVGLALVREYVARLVAAAAQGKYERVCLIAHEELVGFYESAGLRSAGMSGVVHGARPWFELRKELADATPAPEPTETPAPAVPDDIWAALQRASSRLPAATQLLSAFAGGVTDVIDAESASEKKPNKFDLLCPRNGCGSVILKAGTASFAERASVQMDAPEDGGARRPECLGPLPAPPAEAQWWLVRGSPMTFENIGFSRPVQQAAPGGGRMKLLVCAECDIGPLGWCEEGGNEYWLPCNRVGYRV